MHMSWLDGTGFGLTEDDITIRDMARAFAQKRVAPLAQKIDHEHYFPEELLPELAELGFMGATVPEQLGDPVLLKCSTVFLLKS